MCFLGKLCNITVYLPIMGVYVYMWQWAQVYIYHKTCAHTRQEKFHQVKSTSGVVLGSHKRNHDKIAPVYISYSSGVIDYHGRNARYLPSQARPCGPRSHQQKAIFTLFRQLHTMLLSVYLSESLRIERRYIIL